MTGVEEAVSRGEVNNSRLEVFQCFTEAIGVDSEKADRSTKRGRSSHINISGSIRLRT